MFSFGSHLLKIYHPLFSFIANMTNRMAVYILILTDDKDQFVQTKEELVSIIGANSYTIYNLTRQDLTKASIWMNNCFLLIELNGSLNRPIQLCFDFLKSGGNILSILNDASCVNNQILNQNDIKTSLELKNQENIGILIDS